MLYVGEYLLRATMQHITCVSAAFQKEEMKELDVIARQHADVVYVLYLTLCVRC